MQELKEISDKVDRILIAVGGDPELGTDGMKQKQEKIVLRVDNHEGRLLSLEDTDKKRKWSNGMLVKVASSAAACGAFAGKIFFAMWPFIKVAGIKLITTIAIMLVLILIVKFS